MKWENGHETYETSYVSLLYSLYSSWQVGGARACQVAFFLGGEHVQELGSSNKVC